MLNAYFKAKGLINPHYHAPLLYSHEIK